MAEWSAVVASVAFVVFVAGLLISARAVLVKLERAQAAAEAVQEDIRKLCEEIGAVMLPLEESAKTAQRAMKSAEGLILAAGEIGDAATIAASAARQITETWSEAAMKHSERIAAKRGVSEAAEWAEIGLTAWQLWQSRQAGK
ncbi:hypothetical protein ACFQZE_01305 [Paenibacillus sp. GCM10027627]|uniref:hypothetical protein n=1 Tax=unclassified Paenibacillus TaxID=185978 RepID=UPI00363A5629